jgi:DNA mismatch repair protein MutS2
MYAANEDGVLNASVEFDERTLQPTYRLIVGVAGSSSGLEIARRFGVPSSIIDRARNSLKESSLQATEYLRRIKRESEEAENLRVALEEERAAVAEKFASLEVEALKRERNREETFEKTLSHAVADFERRSRESTARITDRADRLKVEKEAQKQVAELKREVQRAVQTTTTQDSDERPGVKVIRDGKVVSKLVDAVEDYSERYVTAPPREIVVGDKVKLKSFGSVGIVDQIKGDEAEVRVKALRFREKLNNLELLQSAPQPSEMGKLEKLRRAQHTEVHLQAAEQTSESELNVIGQTTDEAVDAVDKFLDEASLASLSQVRIVHGHGTGALRRAIGDLLRDHPHVARFTAAPPNQGGTGATLVELRQ